MDLSPIAHIAKRVVSCLDEPSAVLSATDSKSMITYGLQHGIWAVACPMAYSMQTTAHDSNRDHTHDHHSDFDS